MTAAPATSDTEIPPARRERLGIWSLAAANGISQFGNSLTALAIPWFVLVTTGSASRTGIAGAVVAVSPVVAGLISGPIVDRLGFRRASIASDALSGVTVALIPTLYLLGWLSFWQLLVLIFLGAFFDVPGHTGRSALVPALVKRSRMPLERANSVLQLSTGTSDAIIAPLIGGALIAAVGAAEVLFVDAGTFALSILIVALLIPVARVDMAGPASEEKETPAPGGKLDEFLAGFRFVLRDPVLRTFLPIAILTNFVGRAYGGVLLPVYVLDEFGNATYLGFLGAALGVGVFGGIILYGAYGSRIGRYTTLIGSFAVIAVAIWIFTIWAYLPTNLLGFFIFGLALGPLNPMLQTVVQTRTPEHLLGRVLSAIYTLFTVAAPLGVLFAGVTVDALGLRAVMFLAAVLLTLVPLWLALSPWSRTAAPAFEE
jgi:MFS family permease